MRPFTLKDFVAESNRIEFMDEVKEHEVDAHIALLALPEITIPHLERFVEAVGGGPLRDRPGMNVRVGNHYPPPGAPRVRQELQAILDTMTVGKRAAGGGSPYAIHHRYESLHPFMDGNGRSGRALWLWQMGGVSKNPLGFLHSFYYQALDAGQR